MSANLFTIVAKRNASIRSVSLSNHRLLLSSLSSSSLQKNITYSKSTFYQSSSYTKINLQLQIQTTNKRNILPNNNLNRYLTPRCHYSQQQKIEGLKEEESNNAIIKRENIYTIPNLLTVSRLIMTPAIGFFIMDHCYTEAFFVLGVAAFTDLLDGFIARRYNQKTFFGSALDPMADKVLMTTLVVALTSVQLLPLPLALLILGRDIGLIAGTAYVRYMSLPEPKTLKRYFDVSFPSAEVRPPLISKINTFLQLLLMAASLASPIYGFQSSIFMEFLRYTVATTTTWSAAHYWLKRSTIKVIGKDWRKS